MKTVVFFICLFISALSLCGQTKHFVGIILDKTSGEAVAYANIYFPDLQKGTISDARGYFSLPLQLVDSFRVQVSCVGYAKLEQTLKIHSEKIIQIKLSPKIQRIDEITVIAKEKNSAESSSLISKEAISHIQPESFADIIELLPGKTSAKLNLTSMQLISLREPIQAASSYNSEYEHNTSLGTAFIIDGQQLSNDAELHNVTGYLSGGGLDLNLTNITGKGIDMRSLPTDDIESIEIIRGIPSVKYGDLTSGVVKIERNYKAKPWLMRFKATPTSKLFAAGKGFALPNKQSINLNVDYLNFKTDPRSPNKNYSRLTGSLRYAKKIENTTRLIKVKINADYTGSFDEKRIDPEIDFPETDFFEEKYHKLAFNSTIYYKNLKYNFFKGFDYKLSSNMCLNENNISRAVTGSFEPITTNRNDGEFYSTFLPGSYVAKYTNSNKPMNITSSMNTYFNFFTASLSNRILLGANWRYDKNWGEGEVYNPQKPLYVGTGRPRAHKDIPSIQKFSFYIEDEICNTQGKHRIRIVPGLRGGSMLNLADNYTMHNKMYFDPRVNASWTLPKLEIRGKKTILSLNAGYGMHTKFPGLSHLYPQKLYIDRIQLNYFSQNEALRQVQYKTKSIDIVNYNIKPNRNAKIELGFHLSWGQVHFDVTAYREELKNGFKQQSHITKMEYKLYDISSGPKPSELSQPPRVEMFDYEEKKTFVSYAKKSNGAYELKSGIEYQLDLGRIEKLKSRISINGAFMKSKYDLSQARYSLPSAHLVNENYPYFGYYMFDRGKTYEQFNTNIRFDTQIDKLQLIFSTLIENIWYTNQKYNPNNGMPSYYYDYDLKQYTYTENDKNDPILRFLYEKTSYPPSRVPYEGTINLKVTKIIAEKLKLAFYINNLIYLAPDYKDKYGHEINRKAYPYFGMEISLNI